MSKGPGHPTLYKPEYCEKLIEHMSGGFSFESFAGLLRVSKQTIYDWSKAHSEFLDAKRVGTEISRLKWETDGINGVWEETEFENGKPSYKRKINSAIWIVNMRNRFGWKAGDVDREDDKDKGDSLLELMKEFRALKGAS